MTTTPTLAPVQQHASTKVLGGRENPDASSPCSALTGRGRTTVLRAAQASSADVAEFDRDIQGRHCRPAPLAIEDALYDLLASALEAHEVVLLMNATSCCPLWKRGHFYPRAGLITFALTALVAQLERRGRTLVVAANYVGRCRCRGSGVGSHQELGADDYPRRERLVSRARQLKRSTSRRSALLRAE